MRVCILGAGALGSAIGGTLAEAGHDVTLISRNRAHIDAIRAYGLKLRTDGVDRLVGLDAATTTTDMVPADLVIVLVKSLDTEAAIHSAQNIVGPETVVISLQNGLAQEEVLAGIVGKDRVLAGKTYTGGVMLAAGHVISGTKGKETIIGELDGTMSARVTGLAKTLTEAGLETTVSPNILGAMWDKLLVNVATGALAGITGLTYGELYTVPEIEAVAIAAVGETMAVAKASGIALQTSDPRAPWVKAAAGLPPEFKTSMLQSLEKGALTEIDFINGSVVRAGERLGIATPVNSALVALIKGVEKKRVPQTKGLRMPAPGAYLEHAAFRVRDIGWHIRFFEALFGWKVRQVDGEATAPKQAWIGGMQLIATPDFEGTEGRVNHLGVRCEDVEAAMAIAYTFEGVTADPRGRNWLTLPEGFVIELLPASAKAVATALTIHPEL